MRIVGKFEIWTSVYAYLEVIKGVAAYGDPYPPEESDRVFEDMLSQPYVKRVQLDVPVATLARRLKRSFHQDGLKKRSDAIHLATAVHHNLEALHTWNRCDLLGLNGKVNRSDGGLLSIIKPGPEFVAEPLFSLSENEPYASEENKTD